MNGKPEELGSDSLVGLVRAAREIRPLPPGFQAAVWRRMGRAEAPRPAPLLSWLDRLADWLLRPKLALAGVAAVVLAGLMVGALDGLTSAKEAARERYLTAVAPVPIR